MHKLENDTWKGKVMGWYFFPHQVGNYTKISSLPNQKSQQVQKPKNLKSCNYSGKPSPAFS